MTDPHLLNPLVIVVNGTLPTPALLLNSILKVRETSRWGIDRMEMSRPVYEYIISEFYLHFSREFKTMREIMFGVCMVCNHQMQDYDAPQILLYDRHGFLVGKITGFPTAPEFYEYGVRRMNAAAAAHEANRILCQSLGDHSQPSWNDAPDWQKKSAIAGVKAILDNPATTPEESHAGWMKQKEADGWKYGPVKDPEKKEHPCFVPYAELPEPQKLKDHLFGIVVRAVIGIPLPEER